MIPHTLNSCKLSEDANLLLPDWQQAMRQAIRDPRELLEMLELPESLLAETKLAQQQFPLLVPRYFAALMEKGNPNDPLLRQVLPLDIELEPQPGFSLDPVGDIKAMKQPGVIHKYKGRVLLTTTPACAVHCRYCFRRHFPYREANPLEENWSKAIDYIKNQPDVNEVILSGGDPLSLSDERLLTLFNKLERIPHLSRLRIHTRQPVMLPNRITPALLETLERTRLKTVMVVHVNHPNELTKVLADSLNKIRLTGTTLLNQSVLLNGVNDDVATLVRLSEQLFKSNVLPYYLHLIDKVKGARHFDVERNKAKSLHTEIQAMLPGYLVPRLVTEYSGALAKHPV
jgi:EF-P beta-lysylation protein EpmB